MAKRHYLFICFLFISLAVFSQVTLKDSLIQILSKTSSTDKRLEITTNLMDISRGQEQVEYAYMLLQEARKADDAYYKEAALTNILRFYVNTDKPDSVKQYLSVTQQELEGEARKWLIGYMQMMMDVRIVCYTEGEERKKILEDCLVKLETDKHISPIQKASAYYILGIAGNITAKTPKEKTEAGRRHFEYSKKAIAAIDKVPLRYSILFKQNIYFGFCTNIDSEEKAKLAINYLKMLNINADYEAEHKRHYTLKRHMLSALTALSSCSKYIGKDLATTYYQQFLVLNKKYPDDASVNPGYERGLTSMNYYCSLNEYEKALPFCDSTMDALRNTPYARYIVEIMPEKIALCDSLGKYEEAAKTYKEYVTLLDSTYQQNMKEHVENLNIKQDADKLIVEKKALELELQQSKTKNYFFLTLFLISVAGIFYVFFRLYQIKSLYNALHASNQQVIIANEKAQESEKMKNAFIRNMYHEVRTPLNAINGFSDLVASEDLPAEDKKEFTKIIHENCIMLTSMLDNVVKISQLDSSNDIIEMTPTCINNLCEEEMGKLKHQSKEHIEYILDGDKDLPLIKTNGSYVSIVIGRLLSNAYKFTKSGSITLSYHTDTNQNKLIIAVSDTGCGIPKDKQEWIFERFSKTNDFMPGTGLGLYLCRQIATRLNGSIDVDSTYTNGARFVFTLPLE